MSMASAAPFSGLSRGEHRAGPGRARPGDRRDGHQRGQDGVHADDLPPGPGLGGRHGGHRRRPAVAAGLAQGRRHRPVRGQVQRVHDRDAQTRRERDGGHVEGVIVHHVVPGLPHARVHAGEGLVRRARVRPGRPGRPVERGGQGLRVDPGVDHRGPWYVRPGRGVDVHVMPPAGQATRQVGHEGLRPAPLRLVDDRHQRRDERHLHPGTCLNARSRGGLIPRTS